MAPPPRPDAGGPVDRRRAVVYWSTPKPPGQHPVSERYQREIEELLRRLDGRPRPEPLSRRLSRRTAGFRSGFQSALRSFLRRPPVEQFMIASIALVLVSLILGLPMFGALATVAYWTSILGLLFFVLAIGLSIANRRPSSSGGCGGGGDRYWRGQVIEYRPRNEGFFGRLRRWFRRRR